MSSEFAGQLEGWICDNCLDINAALALEQEIDIDLVLLIARVIDEISRPNGVAAGAENSCNRTGATGWLPDMMREPLRAHQRFGGAGRCFVKIIFPVGQFVF